MLLNYPIARVCFASFCEGQKAWPAIGQWAGPPRISGKFRIFEKLLGDSYKTRKFSRKTARPLDKIVWLRLWTKLGFAVFSTLTETVMRFLTKILFPPTQRMIQQRPSRLPVYAAAAPNATIRSTPIGPVSANALGSANIPTPTRSPATRNDACQTPTPPSLFLPTRELLSLLWRDIFQLCASAPHNLICE